MNREQIDNLGLDAELRARLASQDPELWDWVLRHEVDWSDKALARRHGDFSKWRRLLNALPPLAVTDVELSERVGFVCERTFTESEAAAYRGLHPWRKGPFSANGVEIDAEWRCDLKWSRFEGSLGNLNGARILDVGGGNGYYSFRLCGRRPELVVCLEPMGLYWAQFHSLRRYLRAPPVLFIPKSLEDFDAQTRFDLALSLGVIYHCRSPLEHLERLRELLDSGGRLIIESLVVPGEGTGLELGGESRYAQMRNVWTVPTVARLRQWLLEAGFAKARLVDESMTTSEEQRRTPWMRFHSLADFLDHTDPSKTVEGHPAPCRAIIEAQPGGAC